MRIHLTGYGGNYELIRGQLTDKHIMDIAFMINNSDRFDFGELSHVVLRDTDKIVGYVGCDSAQLCCPNGENPKNYRIPHSHLRRIFMSV